jgi:hypothetical protein
MPRWLWPWTRSGHVSCHPSRCRRRGALLKHITPVMYSGWVSMRVVVMCGARSCSERSSARRRSQRRRGSGQARPSVAARSRVGTRRAAGRVAGSSK